MTLSTESKLRIATPLTPALSPTGEGKGDLVPNGDLRIAEVTGWKILHIRGSEAEAALAGVDEAGVLAIGEVRRVEGGVLVRLRRDEFVMLGADVTSAKDRLESTSGPALLTVTDLTHGRGIIMLAGVHAADVLPKLCALDFGDKQFPDLHAAQSSLAKVRALIIRMDGEQNRAYYMVVDRSVAGYVAGAILDAAQEWVGKVQSK